MYDHNLLLNFIYPVRCLLASHVLDVWGLCKNAGGDMVGIVMVCLYCNVWGCNVWVLYFMDVWGLCNIVGGDMVGIVMVW